MRDNYFSYSQIKKLILFFFIFGLAFGQDTLTTVSGQILMGKFIKTTDQHIVFKVDYEKEPLLVAKENVETIKVSETSELDEQSKTKKTKFNWYTIPCLCVVALVSMIQIIKEGGFPGFP